MNSGKNVVQDDRLNDFEPLDPPQVRSEFNGPKKFMDENRAILSPAESAPPLDYSAAVLTASQLAEMVIPERVKLMGEWLRDGDIGFIFAPRGVGKSWIALLLGMALARGVSLGEWAAGTLREVLYIDGEMMLADTKERQRMIGSAPHGFRWLHHEHLSQTLGKTLNLAQPECQQAVSKLLPDGSVLILDNLSALCRGMEENANDAWEMMLDWLLSLRRRKITVIIIHHAGRNGQMRGASRREDHADWVLSLKDDTQEDSQRRKCIVSTFTKARGCAPMATLPLRWTLDITSEDFSCKCQPYAGPDALLAVIREGSDTATLCAEALGAPKQSVSRWAQKLAADGLIIIRDRKYIPCAVEDNVDEY